MKTTMTKKEFVRMAKVWMKKNGFKIKYRMTTCCDKKDLFIHYTLKHNNKKLYDFILDGRLMDVYEPPRLSIGELTPIGKHSYTINNEQVYNYKNINDIPLNI